MGKPTVVSTFAGCGGSSLGYKMAGYRELLAIDFDKDACEVFRLNFETEILETDIRKVTAKDIMDACGIGRYDLDLLDGSPPCQGFSAAGKRRVWDERNELYNDFLRLVEGLKPKAFLMENVPGMAYGRMKGIFNTVLIKMKKLKYKVKVAMLNSWDYGVAQTRKRIFWVGFRDDTDKDFGWPKPVSVRFVFKDVVKNIPEPESNEILYPQGKLAKLVKMLPQGECLSKYHPKRHYFNVYRAHYDKPIPTVTKMVNSKMCGILHPEEDRFLTIPELKRLCSFPDYFSFPKWMPFEKRWGVIGNAVMPKQMYYIAKEIKKYL